MPDQREHYEERAAIREFDGQMTRKEAEAAALQDINKTTNRESINEQHQANNPFRAGE